MLAVQLINAFDKVRKFIAKIPVLFNHKGEPYYKVPIADINTKLGIVGRRDTDAETNGVEIWVWEATFPRILRTNARN